MSWDYTTLLKTFYHARRTIIKKRRKQSGRYTQKSLTMQNLELRFSNAIATLQREKSQFSLFAAENLEKLLNYQYEKDKKAKTAKWLSKMNDLDFHNRTRTFFSELRKRHKATENSAPIIDSSGVISTNIDETLSNWAEL